MKISYIDALRGIAILSVIWFHCHLSQFSDTQHYYSIMDLLGSPAAMGVQLFYVLSAFTLFLSQSRRKVADEHTANFFVRRFFRIAPMYYVAIVYYVGQMCYTSTQSLTDAVSENIFGILANVLLLHGLSPVWINSIIPGGWSVGIEVLFYIMVPYLFTRITSLNRAIIFTSVTLCVGFILTSILSSIKALQSDQLINEYLFFYLPYQLPVFGCGIVAYYVVIRQDRSVRPLTIGLAIFSLGFVLISKLVGKSLLPNLPHTLHLFESIGFALLLIGLSKRSVGLLDNPITCYIGKVSYSAYLTHFGVLYWMDKAMPQQLIPVNSLLTNILNFNLKFLLVVLVTVLISTATYYWVEEPSQNFGKRFLRKRSLPESLLEKIV